MFPWASDTPYRTGVPTIRKAAIVMCGLFATFTPIIKQYLDVSRHVYVDALNQACSDFIDNVPSPRP